MSINTISYRRSFKQIERDKEIDYLNTIYLKPGDVVYIVLRHIGRSGMTRYIDLYVMMNNEPRRITWNVSKALESSYNRNHEALLAHGWGLDVGLQTVQNLGYVLFNDSNALQHRWM